MQKYASNVQQTNGDALTGASVTVYTDSAHTTKATIYSDNGITQTTNPLTTDTDGEFSFYAADGRYYLGVSKTGITTQYLDDVLLFDPNASTGSAYVKFTPSGTGGTTEDTQTALRRFVFADQYNGSGPAATAAANATGIQDAIDAVTAGGTLYFSAPGTWTVTGNSLTISKSLNVFLAPGVVLKIDTSGTTVPLFTVSGSHVYFYGGCFDLGSITTAHRLFDVTGSYVSFNGCEFKNSAATESYPNNGLGYAVNLKSSWKDVTVRDSHIHGTGYGVITDSASTGSGLFVDGNLFEYLNGDGVCLNVPTSGTVEDATITNNSFRLLGSANSNLGMGVSLSGQSSNTAAGTIKRTRIIGNNFDQCDRAAVHIEDGAIDTIVKGNNVYKCTNGSGLTSNGQIEATGIATTAGFNITGLVIEGNTLTNASGGGTVGINVTIAGSGNKPLDVVIANNKIDMAGVGGGSGVGLRCANTTGYTVSGNSVKNTNGIGIVVNASISGLVIGNHSFDDQGVPTQTYGIQYNVNTSKTIFACNQLIGNTTGGFNRGNATSSFECFNLEADSSASGPDTSVKSAYSAINTIPMRVDFDALPRYPDRQALSTTGNINKYWRYVALTGASPYTVTLPTAANAGTGAEVIIKNETSDAGTYTIQRASTDTIDGATTTTIAAAYGVKRLRSDGTSAWFSI